MSFASALVCQVGGGGGGGCCVAHECSILVNACCGALPEGREGAACRDACSLNSSALGDAGLVPPAMKMMDDWAEPRLAKSVNSSEVKDIRGRLFYQAVYLEEGDI